MSEWVDCTNIFRSTIQILWYSNPHQRHFAVEFKAFVMYSSSGRWDDWYVQPILFLKLYDVAHAFLLEDVFKFWVLWKKLFSCKQFRGVAKIFLEGLQNFRPRNGWLTNKTLGHGTGKTVNFGPFSMRFHVLYPVSFSHRTVLLTLTLNWEMSRTA